MNLRKGFTLIELLVVIAIIGILAAAVLGNLNSARQKGADAAIKSNLGSIRAQAEIIYDDNNCYDDELVDTDACQAAAVAPGACANTADTLFGDSIVWQGITAATAQASIPASGNACSASANQQSYAIVVQLKTDPLKGWCVDSTGKAKEVTLASANQAGLTAEVNAAGACVE